MPSLALHPCLKCLVRRLFSLRSPFSDVYRYPEHCCCTEGLENELTVVGRVPFAYLDFVMVLRLVAVVEIFAVVRVVVGFGPVADFGPVGVAVAVELVVESAVVDPVVGEAVVAPVVVGVVIDLPAAFVVVEVAVEPVLVG